VPLQDATDFIRALRRIVEDNTQGLYIQGTAKVITDIQVARDGTRVAFHVQDTTHNPLYNPPEWTHSQEDTDGSQPDSEGESHTGNDEGSETGDEGGYGSDSDGD
jgi:hypothetical protein